LTPPKLQQLQPQALRAARLGREWFARDAIVISRALLGCFLVHEGVPEGGREGADARDNGLRVSRIVETEAYRGPEDLACHARAGLTRRTRSLLGEEGHAYVFLVYGMHECFNVTCAGIGRGHAVLVRAGEPTFGFEAGARLDGPGRFAREMGISRRMDGSDLTAPPLYVCGRRGRPRVAVTARVGVAYSGDWADRPWRFYDAASAHVSRPPKKFIGSGLQRFKGARPDGKK